MVVGEYIISVDLSFERSLRETKKIGSRYLDITRKIQKASKIEIKWLKKGRGVLLRVVEKEFAFDNIILS